MSPAPARTIARIAACRNTPSPAPMAYVAASRHRPTNCSFCATSAWRSGGTVDRGAVEQHAAGVDERPRPRPHWPSASKFSAARSRAGPFARGSSHRLECAMALQHVAHGWGVAVWLSSSSCSRSRRRRRRGQDVLEQPLASIVGAVRVGATTASTLAWPNKPQRLSSARRPAGSGCRDVRDSVVPGELFVQEGEGESGDRRRCCRPSAGRRGRARSGQKRSSGCRRTRETPIRAGVNSRHCVCSHRREVVHKRPARVDRRARRTC